MHRIRKGIIAAVLVIGVLGLSLTGSAFAASKHQTSAARQSRAGLVTYIAHIVGESTVARLRQDLKAGKTLL